MNRDDMAKLDKSVADFEKTVDALNKITEICSLTQATSDHFTKTSEDLDDKMSAMKGNSDRIAAYAEKMSLDYEKSSEDLDTKITAFGNSMSKFAQQLKSNTREVSEQLAKNTENINRNIEGYEYKTSAEITHIEKQIEEIDKKLTGKVNEMQQMMREIYQQAEKNNGQIKLSVACSIIAAVLCAVILFGR